MVQTSGLLSRDGLKAVRGFKSHLLRVSKNGAALCRIVFGLFWWWDLNEGWVGGKATGFPPCRRLFRTEGSENAASVTSE